LSAGSGDVHTAALSNRDFNSLCAQPPGEPVNLLGGARCEIAGSSWMQRYEIHERLALASQSGELSHLLGPIVQSAEHHVLERYATIEHLRGLDDAGEWILGIDRHQRLAQLVIGA